MVAAWLVLLHSTALAADPKVTITGGAEDVGHHYSWVVTNQHWSPIVRVEFPHYRAYLFHIPEGWSAETTNLVHVGTKDEPGVCVAVAPSTVEGIARRQSAEFGMQVGDLRAKPRPGIVVVHFADGSEVRVDGVAMPTRVGVGDDHVPLIGLGLIFVVWLLLAAVRRRSRKTPRAGDHNPVSTPASGVAPSSDDGPQHSADPPRGE